MNNVELGFKNRKVKFSDEVENTQSATKQKLNPSDGIPKDFFASNGRQEVDDIHSDQMSDDPKNLAVITLYSCDIKPVILLNIHQKTKDIKSPLTVLLYMGASYSCVRAEYSHLEMIQRRRKTFFSTPNGTFLSNK